MGKENKNKMVTYSLRVDRERWALFCAIAALRDTDAVDVLRELIDSYIREHGAVLSVAAETAQKK